MTSKAGHKASNLTNHVLDCLFSADTKIFDEQELGGAIVEGEDNDLFLVDAKQDITPTTDQLDVAEDNTDLFK